MSILLTPITADAAVSIAYRETTTPAAIGETPPVINKRATEGPFEAVIFQFPQSVIKKNFRK
jgi:hypothetical protein